MQHDDDNRELMRRYLLGTLDEDESETVEQRLLTDGEYVEQLELVEEDLIEQYVSGDLPARDRESFEQRFLTSPERRQKLSFAMALNRYAAVRQESDRRFPSNVLRARTAAPIYLIAASLLLFVAVALWLVLRDRQQQDFVTITAALRPGVVRDSGEIKRIAVPDNADVVRLELEIGASDYKEYRATVVTADGAEVFKSGSLKIESGARDKFVALTVPADLLKPGDYQAKLSGLAGDGGFEDFGKYYFRVLK